jgi:hypothetical protein
MGRVTGGDIHSNLPILRGCQLDPREKARAVPGFFALQSAQVLLPGTVLIKSCRARSLRACWRLFRTEAMIWRRRRRSRSGGSYGGRGQQRQERTLKGGGRERRLGWIQDADWLHGLTGRERFHDREQQPDEERRLQRSA